MEVCACEKGYRNGLGKRAYGVDVVVVGGIKMKEAPRWNEQM